MATNLSDLGLENLSKSSQWTWLKNSLSLNNINHTSITNTFERFEKEIETLICKEKAEYHNTINELLNEIKSLRSENIQIKAELKEVLTSLSVKKPVGQEIAELQARIMQLYNEKDKN